MKKQRPLWAVIFGLLLTAFTLYVMLDVFVIKRPIKENATEMNLSLFASITPKNILQADTPTPSPTSTPSPIPSPTPKISITPNPLDSVTPIPTPTDIPTPVPTDTPTPIPTPTNTPKPKDPNARVTEAPLGKNEKKPQFSSEVISEDDYYSNDHLCVIISEFREHDTQIHVAEVWVSSAQYILTAFAKDTYGRNIMEKTSVMAERNNAVLAMNADNYGAREGGYCIRNGILYRTYGNTTKDVLCIMPDGDFYFSHYYKATAKELLDKGTWQGFTFGPVLVNDSKIQVKPNDEVALSYVTNPRTAIGMVEPLHYYFIVADGRTKKSHGLSLYELADLMQRLGCTKGFNLDGGGSSTMVFRGNVINFPTSDGPYYEREVSDIVYVR